MSEVFPWPKPGQQLQALTLHQPWASLMAIGAKQIETRDWRPSLRPGDLVVIHSSRAWAADELTMAREQPYFAAALRYGLRRGLLATTLPDDPTALPLGSVVAIARFSSAHATTDRAIQAFLARHPYERVFGNYRPNRVGWLFDVVRAVRPVPARGRLGLWPFTVPTEGLQPLRQEDV